MSFYDFRLKVDKAIRKPKVFIPIVCAIFAIGLVLFILAFVGGAKVKDTKFNVQTNDDIWYNIKYEIWVDTYGPSAIESVEIRVETISATGYHCTSERVTIDSYISKSYVDSGIKPEKIKVTILKVDKKNNIVLIIIGTLIMVITVAAVIIVLSKKVLELKKSSN